MKKYLKEQRKITGVKTNPEAKFQTVLLKALRKIPHSWFQKINDRTTVGIPDIAGCIRGIFVLIEVKSAPTDWKRKGEKLQKKNLKRVANIGGVSFAVWPDPESDLTMNQLMTRIANSVDSCITWRFGTELYDYKEYYEVGVRV